MKFSARNFVLLIFIVVAASGRGQSLEALKPDAEREKMFFPYLAIHHGGPEQTLRWKESNTLQYYRELWYFCKSFYIKRNHLAEGAVLPESAIDITRFETSRKQNEEALIMLPGMKDALVLLPVSQLLYEPEYLPR